MDWVEHGESVDVFLLAPLLKFVYGLNYMAQKVEKFKRKTHIERSGLAWRSESISSEEGSLPPLEKKVKSTDHMESEWGSETDDVVATLEMIKRVMPKIELVLERDLKRWRRNWTALKLRESC